METSVIAELPIQFSQYSKLWKGSLVKAISHFRPKLGWD